MLSEDSLHVLHSAIYHTVLSELSQKDLMTAKELKWLGETADLTGCLVQFLYTKSQDVVDRAANLLCKLGYEEEERQLRG